MRWLAIVLSFLLLPSIPRQAQRVLIGVKSGLTGLNDFEGSGDLIHSETRIYTLGPAVELKLWRSLTVEAGLLYHRIGYFNTWFSTTNTTRIRANAWDFSALGKYYVSTHGVRPYAAAGWAFRKFSGVSGTNCSIHTDPNSGQPVETTDHYVPRYLFQNPAGPTGAFGVQFKAGRLRIGPEVRYTHWLTRALTEYDKGSFFQSKVDQLDFLLGLSF